MVIGNKEFIAVLFGNDINTYSVSRAFYEAYGIRSVVIGKFNSGPSCNSKIIEYHAKSDLDDKEVFIQALDEIAAKYSDKKVIVMGCGDNYVELIIQNRSVFRKNIIVPYVDENMMNDLITKKSFYKMCDTYGIDYPKTFVYYKELGENFSLPFDFPLILKPSNGVNYWKNPFKTQQKVYRIYNNEQLKTVINEIYEAGYPDELILQEFVPGDDSQLRVMIGFSGTDKKVKLMSLANVLLEEHTPHGLGNASFSVTEYNEELSYMLKNFLEGIGYVGFFTFDIKYDHRYKKYKVLEINLRQGRSNYYVTGAGHNLAKYVVEDYIYNRDTGFQIVKEDNIWLAIPLGIALKYVKDKDKLDKVNKLVKAKKISRPLFLRGDNNLMRMIFLYKSQLSHYFKYKKYYK